MADYLYTALGASVSGSQMRVRVLVLRNRRTKKCCPITLNICYNDLDCDIRKDD